MEAWEATDVANLGGTLLCWEKLDTAIHLSATLSLVEFPKIIFSFKKY